MPIDPRPPAESHRRPARRGDGTTTVAVVGAGYVGLTTAACLAHLGHDVSCADVDQRRVTALADGSLPLVEDGLGELVREGVAAGRLRFVLGAEAAVGEAEVVFLCLPTPRGPDGGADTSYVVGAARRIGPLLAPGATVVNKSTVPIGSADLVEDALARPDLAVVSNPEFLREGSAVADFLHPDRVVVGSRDQAAASRVAALFAPLGAPVLVTDPTTAETIKYAANAFLATRLSFVNSLAQLCEATGADVAEVTRGMGLDPRIGAGYLRPGPGWGGSCLPKDTDALLRAAEEAGVDFALLRAAVESNTAQLRRVAEVVADAAGGDLGGEVVAAWGLTFKAGTDDLRDSPAIEVVGLLTGKGATVRAYDPTRSDPLPGLEVVGTPIEACEGAGVLVVLTEWEQFRRVDLTAAAARMRTANLVDTRALLDAGQARRAGFAYRRLGSR